MASFGRFKETEMVVYKHLGVKHFRMVLVGIERFRHRCDGLKNENYHFKGKGVVGANRFSGYLLYNTLIHVISILIVAICFFIPEKPYPEALPIDVVAVLLVIFNVYCIMLQRYTYLRLCKYLVKAKQRQGAAVDNAVAAILKKFKISADGMLLEKALVKRLVRASQNGGECYISTEDIPTLERIAEVLKAADFKLGRRRNDRKFKGTVTLLQTVDSIKSQRLLATKIGRQVSNLQNFFRLPPDRNVLFEFAIVTENADVEAAYRKVFFSEISDNFYLVLNVLNRVYGMTKD